MGCMKEAASTCEIAVMRRPKGFGLTFQEIHTLHDMMVTILDDSTHQSNLFEFFFPEEHLYVGGLIDTDTAYIFDYDYESAGFVDFIKKVIVDPESEEYFSIKTYDGEARIYGYEKDRRIYHICVI